MVEYFFFFYSCYWSTCRHTKRKFYFVSLISGIIKKLFTTIKTQSKVLVIAKSKLNSIGNLVSQALIDIEISHEEFITILNEKENERKRQKHK